MLIAAILLLILSCITKRSRRAPLPLQVRKLLKQRRCPCGCPQSNLNHTPCFCDCSNSRCYPGMSREDINTYLAERSRRLGRAY